MARQAPPQARSGPAVAAGVFGTTIRLAVAVAATVATLGAAAGGRWCRAMGSRDAAGNRRWPFVLAGTVASASAALVLVTPRLAIRVGVLNLIVVTVAAWTIAAGIGWHRRRRTQQPATVTTPADQSPWAWNALATELYETLACWMWVAAKEGMPPAEALAMAAQLRPPLRNRLLLVAETIAAERGLADTPRAWWVAVAAGLRAELHPSETPRSGLPTKVIPFRPRRAAS